MTYSGYRHEISDDPEMYKTYLYPSEDEIVITSEWEGTKYNDEGRKVKVIKREAISLTRNELQKALNMLAADDMVSEHGQY